AGGGPASASPDDLHGALAARAPVPPRPARTALVPLGSRPRGWRGPGVPLGRRIARPRPSTRPAADGEARARPASGWRAASARAGARAVGAPPAVRSAGGAPPTGAPS